MPTYLSPGVYVSEVDSGSRPIESVGTAVAAFIGVAGRGPVNTPVLVSNWRQYTGQFGEFESGGYLAHAVYGWFQNGGGNCYIVRVAPADAADTAPKAAAELPAGTGTYVISAAQGGNQGNDLTVEIADAAVPSPTDGSDTPPPDRFRIVVRNAGAIAETHDDLTTDRGARYAVTVVNAASSLIRLSQRQGGELSRPANGTVRLSGGASAPAAVAVADRDYIGSVEDRSGLLGLEAIDDITIVCAPDLMTAYQHGWVDLDGMTGVQKAMVDHCELMGDRVAILDPPPDLRPQELIRWRQALPIDSKYAALYWPWVKLIDPASGDKIAVPPSGHIAGVWGRNDDTRGVHKAPANETLRGVIDLACDLTSREQELLNPIGINCIRAFPGRGIRVWGARTLSSDPAWKYLNIRRLFNYLEKSILNSTQWCVFEPNDQALWAKIRRTIGDFLLVEWRNGALFGLTPDEAFFVKCDAETNTRETIDLGQVICEIGVAPVKPAEFVVFQLSQYSGGAALAEA